MKQETIEKVELVYARADASRGIYDNAIHRLFHELPMYEELIALSLELVTEDRVTRKFIMKHEEKVLAIVDVENRADWDGYSFGPATPEEVLAWEAAKAAKKD